LVWFAINKTVDRVQDLMKYFIRNANPFAKCNENQIVIDSLIYGTDTSPEGRCIIRELLHAVLNGAREEESIIKLIHFWDKKCGINYLPEDKNYDLYQLAFRASKESFTDIHFVDTKERPPKKPKN